MTWSAHASPGCNCGYHPFHDQHEKLLADGRAWVTPSAPGRAWGFVLCARHSDSGAEAVFVTEDEARQHEVKDER